MYPFERLDKIMDRLREKGRIRVREEADLMGVSNATFHRDLDRLESRGLIDKVRGGAVLRQQIQPDSHFDLRLDVNIKEKKLIARHAVKVIRDDTSIFLDHSTSATFLANELKKRPFRNLIILTNSLAIPDELAGHQGIEVILTGGVVRHDFKAMSGRWVINSFKYINIHQIFAGIGALSCDRGFMTQVHFIQEILAEILTSGPEVNILADATKFHKIGTFQVAPIKTAHRIFTNAVPPKPILEKIQSMGPRIVY